jgi:hypothetical protein
MSGALRTPPDDVPTLTEVVRPSELVPTDAPDAVLWRADVLDAVLSEVRLQLDDRLRARLRERLPALLDACLEPLLDGLVQEVRQSLSDGLQDTVRQALSTIQPTNR